jgi:hypothetical protein
MVNLKRKINSVKETKKNQKNEIKIDINNKNMFLIEELK